jgi:hypothetical protein
MHHFPPAPAAGVLGRINGLIIRQRLTDLTAKIGELIRLARNCAIITDA